MVGLVEVVKYGAVLSLFAFAFLVFLAYQEQKKHLDRLRQIKSRLEKLSALVDAVVLEKNAVSSRMKNTVDRQALQAVLEQTAGSLTRAVLLQVARVPAKARRG